MEGRFPRVLVVGTGSGGGAYLLRIRLRGDRRVRFGRFGRGEPLLLPAGEYAYVGSAMGTKGAASPAARLVRHATRTRGRRPHGIRKELVEYFEAAGWRQGEAAGRGKSKHWHIDYLLDLEEAEIGQVILVLSNRRLEERLARRLAEDPHVQVIGRGLGASDAAGSTHLFRVEAVEEWWKELTEELKEWSAAPNVDSSR